MCLIYLCPASLHTFSRIWKPTRPHLEQEAGCSNILFIICLPLTTFNSDIFLRSHTNLLRQTSISQSVSTSSPCFSVPLTPDSNFSNILHPFYLSQSFPFSHPVSLSMIKLSKWVRICIQIYSCLKSVPCKSKSIKHNLTWSDLNLWSLFQSANVVHVCDPLSVSESGISKCQIKQKRMCVCLYGQT